MRKKMLYCLALFSFTIIVSIPVTLTTMGHGWGG